MKNMAWSNVQGSGDFEKLPVGWYVCKIVDVEDVPNKEYIFVTYDIADGEYAGFYEGQDAKYHRTVVSYNDKAEGMFKGFLDILEDGNPDKFTTTVWERNCNPKDFIGLLFGAAIQERLYTKDNGDDGSVLEIARRIKVGKVAENIASGKALPEPRDQRTIVPMRDKYAGSVYDGEIPFS